MMRTMVMSIINGKRWLGRNDKNDDDEARGYGRDNGDIGGVYDGNGIGHEDGEPSEDDD